MKKLKYTIPFLGGAPVFPPVAHANSDGLLAVGGDLSPERLIAAYRQGIFPWFNVVVSRPQNGAFPGEVKGLQEYA